MSTTEKSLKEVFTEIASAIRSKLGISDKIKPTNMANLINSISAEISDYNILASGIFVGYNNNTKTFYSDSTVPKNSLIALNTKYYSSMTTYSSKLTINNSTILFITNGHENAGSIAIFKLNQDTSSLALTNNDTGQYITFQYTIIVPSMG